jgi:hypothetical protein
MSRKGIKEFFSFKTAFPNIFFTMKFIAGD